MAGRTRRSRRILAAALLALTAATCAVGAILLVRERSGEPKPSSPEPGQPEQWIGPAPLQRSAESIAGERQRASQCRAGDLKICKDVVSDAHAFAGNPERADALEFGCNQGLALACYKLGDWLRRGTGVDPDWTRARGLFARAMPDLERDCLAEPRGDRFWSDDVCLAAVEARRAGRGTTRDLARATELLRRGCVLAVGGRCCEQLGVDLKFGGGPRCHLDDGTELKDETACKGMEKTFLSPEDAAKVGECYVAVAERFEGAAYSGDCPGVVQKARSQASYRRALEFSKTACTNGLASSCRRVGRMLQMGLGTATDLEGAQRSYSRAAQLRHEGCDRGHLDDCASWVEMLWEGDGIQEDWERSTELAHKMLPMIRNACRGDKQATELRGRIPLNGPAIISSPAMEFANCLSESPEGNRYRCCSVWSERPGR